MQNAECRGGRRASPNLPHSADRAAPPTLYTVYRTLPRPPLNPSPPPAAPIQHSAFIIQHFPLPDLPHVHELLQGLVLVADHVGVGFELALGFHELGEFGGGFDVGAFDEAVVEDAEGGAEAGGVGVAHEVAAELLELGGVGDVVESDAADEALVL